MPTFRVTSPDGRTFRVTAPEGATQEEAIAYVQSQNAKAPTDNIGALDDPGALQAGIIGAGRMTDRLLQGAKQAYYGMTDNQAELDRMRREEEDKTRRYATLQAQHPMATTAGEIAPLVGALPAVGGIVSAAALGALPGAIEYGTPEERAMRAGVGAIGGGIGAGAGKLIGRAAQPVRSVPNLTQQGAQAAAQRLGVQLRPSELAQSRPLGWFEAALNDLPFSGGMAQKAEQTRREAINAAAAKSVGQNATELTEGVLATARSDIGSTFDGLLKGRQILLDNTFRSEVKNVIPSRVMKALRDEGVEEVVKPFQNLPSAPVKVTGEWFQQNKTALDNAIRSAYTNGQSGKAKALEDFEDALVGAATRSMTKAESDAFKAAQKQWASLRLLETGKVVEAGNVMPGRLDTALTSRYKHAYKEGKVTGELPDIGKLAQVYKPLPQSGTTPRALYSGMAGGAMFAEPVTAASMMAVPPLAQKFLQSPAGRAYLTQGLLNVTPQIDRRLTQAGYGMLGAPLSSLID